ncbi:hypothetical protein BYT27DRAFT_7216977 [Phlegmacium glaucopus]|nr:hypothetical protein BYT27DRAFT_7216977 [Phlegmacium glaucopus]
MCSDINAMIAGNPGPVTNSVEACKWLETKGWVLAGEDYDQLKLVKILLTISLLPKMLPEAINATHAAAYLLEDDINDKSSSLIALAVASKVKTDLSSILTDLSAAQSFFEASSTQQANTTLLLKEMATQNSTTVGCLADIVSKLNVSLPSTPVPAQWPSLQPSQPSLPTPSHDPSAAPSIGRLQQHLLLSARTILVHVDSDNATAPPDRMPADMLKICNELNTSLAELVEPNPYSWDSEDGPRPKTYPSP